MIIRKTTLALIGLLLTGSLSAQVYYQSDFNSGLPGTWTVNNGGNSNDTWKHVTDYNGNTLDGTPFMNVSSDQSGTDTLVEELITPGVNISSADFPVVTFDHYFTPFANEEAHVDVWDGSQWVNVRTFTNGQGNWGNPATPEIDLTPYKNGALKVRFRYNDKGAWGLHWSVDNVVIKNKQCFDPSNLEVIRPNANSAYVTWDTPYPNAEWQIRFGPAGFFPGTGDTILATNDTTAIGPLNPNTEYEFYVREFCINGDTSLWVGSSTFKTRCNAFQVPYYEDMESFNVDYNATGYECWIPDPSNTTGEYRWNTNSGGTGSGSTGPANDHTTGTSTGIYAYTEASSGSAGDVATLSSSKIDLVNIKHPNMFFWYHRYGNDMGDLHVDVSTDNGQTWDLNVMPPLTGEQHSNETAPWKQGYVDLSAYSNEVIMVRFRGVSDGSFNGDMAIDDISIREAAARDLKVKSMISPTQPDCYTNNHPVEVPVVNGGLDSIDLTQTNVTVTVEVSGVINQTLSTTITNNSLNGGQPLATLDSIIVPVGNLNMGSNGLYQLEAYVNTINGDTLGVNDTTTQSIFVQNPSGGTVSGGGDYCLGDTAALEVNGQFGEVQWQMNDGSGWTNVPATGNDSTTLRIAPTDTTYFRVEVCGSATSNEDTVFINEVSPPSVVNDTFCKGVDVTATLEAQGNGDFFWYETPKGDQIVDTGNSSTVSVQYVDKTYWVSRADSSTPNPVLISEIDHGGNDGVELQNVSVGAVDLSGWTVALNDYSSIDTWNNNADHRWDLSGTLASGATLEGNENLGSFNMGWVSNDEGWVMLIDDNGNVVDWAPFGWTQSEIQNFNANILGVNVNGSNHWSGPGITACGFGENFQRIGDSDNDDATDWICNSNKSMGAVNNNLELPFGGCRSQLVPVTAFAEECAGVESFDEERSFSVFPNPADERFFVEMKGAEAIDGTFRIMDLEGRVLRQEERSFSRGRNSINTSDLADGVYMLNFRSEEGNFTKKLVIR